MSKQFMTCVLLAVFVEVGHGEAPLAEAVSTMRLHSLFTDHMVIQRDAEIVVRGRASPGAPIVVSLADRNGKTICGADGQWKVALKPMQAGGPHELKVVGDTTIILRDILIGDVWLCAGQSNMAWSFGSIGNRIKAASGTQSHAALEFDRKLSAVNHPNIRLYRIPVQGSPAPLDDFIKVEDNPWFPCLRWLPCTPRYAEHFSNVAYHFGRSLSQDKSVPIGLILNAAGGIPINPYISRPTLEADSEFRFFLDNDAKSSPDEKEKAWEAERTLWRTSWRQDAPPAFHKDSGISADAEGWSDPSLDVSKWLDIQLPGSWLKTTKARGAVWIRRDITIPDQWNGAALALDLGQGSEYQTVYFNGKKIGEEPWRQPDYIGIYHCYQVPAELVKAGKATIAARLFDYGGGGGLSNPLFLCKGEERQPLAGAWKLKVESTLDMNGLRPWTVGASSASAFRPGASFNAVIQPMRGFAIAGVIWYQGEGDASQSNAGLYRKLLPAMINDWRKALGCGDFPFLAVQLANFGKVSEQPGESFVADLRESQTYALKLPKTALVAAIDLGEVDIHPSNKKDVGERLALAARSLAYGENVEYSGPVYESMKIEGDKALIRFSHIGGGLLARDGQPLRQFAIAGADRKFAWAKAEIEGDSVRVWSDAVAAPVAVRYAWADNPEGCNLCDKQGLPARPFRTDDWEHEKQKK